eukprot:7620470-Pyramimonas_sp.AAC.1
MLKRCEQIPLVMLEQRGRRLNLQPVLVGACSCADRSASFMVLFGVVAPAPYEQCGLVAGCSMAATLIVEFGTG